MIQRWIKPIRLAAGGLALLAALACSLLPGGFLPKLAGPCGRQLCNCAPEPLDESCHLCKVAPARTVLALDTNISAAETPGVALQVVFSGILAPQRIQAPSASGQLELNDPCGVLFAVSESVIEIVTPPPRS